MPPLVSILIPAYNSAPWIAATLESALAQTWPRVEVIVIDDGSRDDTLVIARTFETRGVRVLTQPNTGQSATFNKALSLARGDYIEFLDADDLLAPDKIERQIALLARRAPGTLAAGAWARFTHDPAEARFIPEAVWTDLSPVEWLVASWEGGGMMHGAAWLVSRSLVDKVGGWNAELSLINDFDFFTRLVLASEGVAFCAEARSYYRSGISGSLSNQRTDRAWRSALASLNSGTTALLAREDSPRTRHAAALNFQRLVYDAYPQAPAVTRAAETRIRELGGARLAPEGGRLFRCLARVLGWKASRRLQLAGNRFRRRAPR